jgi:hypothetical protein
MAKLARVEEWIGGTVDVPSFVVGDEGGPYRPKMLLWAATSGGIVGNTLIEQGADPVERCVASLQEAIRAPQSGRPRKPTRVRIDSPELAAALRSALAPSIDVVHAPTPEIDALEAHLRAFLKDSPSEQAPTYLTHGIDADANASFFRAAARLHRAAPWKVVPDDASVVSVRIDALGVKNAVVSVLGQLGESFAVILFASLRDFEAHLAIAEEAAESGSPPEKVSPSVALNFDRGADLEPELRKEIAAHGWEVAGPDAYPSITAMDADIVGRPPTAREQTTLEAIALALTAWIEAEPALGKAWDDDVGLARTFTVTTHAGPVEVALAVVPREHGGDELFLKFRASPEAATLAEPPHWANLVLDFAANHLELQADEIRRADLEEILYGLIPRKVSCDPGEGGAIVAELRAFWTFAARLGMPHANECLRVLDGDAAKTLDRELANPANFGMAKSILMGGQEMGFDMQSPEGVRAFMSTRGGPLPAMARAPRPVASSAVKKAKKAKRKQASASKRKNR